MEKITLGEENIETVGLLFEPNFFHIHCYSDPDGAEFVKTISCNRNNLYDFAELRSKNHLFAVTSSLHWTLIPSAIFREKDAVGYLKLNTGFTGSTSLSYSSLQGLECVLIHEQDEEAEKTIAQIQPALEIKHLANSILEYGRRKVSVNKGDFLHVLVLEQSAIVSIFKDGSLVLANSIEIDNSEDLIYYIFYSLKKLGISTEIQAELGGTGKWLPTVKMQAMKFLPKMKDIEEKSRGNQLVEIIPQCA